MRPLRFLVASASSAADDDGGCTVSPSAPVDALAVLAAPRAFGLLSVARRRRRRAR